jgi:hypothetical protein
LYLDVHTVPSIRSYAFLAGSFFRFVLAKSSSCFADMDFAICFDAPFKLDFDFSPRLAANAAPAAICCFFDFTGISPDRRVLNGRIYTAEPLFVEIRDGQLHCRRHCRGKIEAIVLLFVTLLDILVGGDISNGWEIVKIIFVFRSYIIFVNWFHANCSHSLNLADV